jgi:hypothetical protein
MNEYILQENIFAIDIQVLDHLFIRLTFSNHMIHCCQSVNLYLNGVGVSDVRAHSEESQCASVCVRVSE